MRKGIILSSIIISVLLINNIQSSHILISHPIKLQIVQKSSSTVITKRYNKLTNYIKSQNTKITRKEAREWSNYIVKELKAFKTDSYMKGKGVTHLITPELFIVLLSTESNFNTKCISRANAMGLAQVMPLHCDNLKAAGILENGDKEELLEWKKNIRAGLYILLTYARGADSLEKALARYNAGPRRERYGLAYARRIITEYKEVFR